jgi:hypothetical protein
MPTSWKVCSWKSKARRSQLVLGAATLHGHLDHALRQVRGEQLDQVVVVAAQVGAAAQRQAGGVGFEQVGGVDRNQPAVALRVEGQRRNDAQTEAEADVGLDHVGIERGQRDVGLRTDALEGAVDARAAGKGRVVGDQRPFRQFIQ